MVVEKINEIKKKALENHVPIVRDNTIEKITDIIKENNCQSILEIGTAVGYSGIVMLSCSNAILTTIEKNHERFEEAKNNFDKCDLTSRVCQIEGDAYEELEKLCLAKQKFDFIFLDGPKGQYIKYLPFLKNLLNNKGILFADNILMGGLLENENQVTHKNRTMVRNMKAFLFELQSDKDFITTLYKIDDGYTITKLKQQS